MYELYVVHVCFGVELWPRMDWFNKVLQCTVVGHVWVCACPRAEISQSDSYKKQTTKMDMQSEQRMPKFSFVVRRNRLPPQFVAYLCDCTFFLPPTHCRLVYSPPTLV